MDLFQSETNGDSIRQNFHFLIYHCDRSTRSGPTLSSVSFRTLCQIATNNLSIISIFVIKSIVKMNDSGITVAKEVGSARLLFSLQSCISLSFNTSASYFRSSMHQLFAASHCSSV